MKWRSASVPNLLHKQKCRVPQTEVNKMHHIGVPANQMAAAYGSKPGTLGTGKENLKFPNHHLQGTAVLFSFKNTANDHNLMGGMLAPCNLTCVIHGFGDHLESLIPEFLNPTSTGDL